MISKKKFNTFIGSIGAAIGIFVFIAYIPQIIANLDGAKAQPWQPLFAAVSCLIWVLYGWSKEPKQKRLDFDCAQCGWRDIGFFDFSDCTLKTTDAVA